MNLDIHARAHHGHTVDLSVAETLAALERPEHRVSTQPQKWGTGVMNWQVLEILHDGKWLQVGRTDLFDNVATGTPLPAPEKFKADPLGYYRDKIWFGARITDTCFSVVDSLSDG